MEDYIPILIMLVITVVGAIAQAKKKKNRAANTPIVEGAKKSPDFWETLFEEDKQEIVEPVAQHEYVHQPVPVIAQKPKPTSPLFKEGSTRRMKSGIKDEIKTEEIGKKVKQKRTLDDFSLKKAVIFSEVLHQKYF